MIKLHYLMENNLKNEEIAPHFHSFYEITYYYSGTGYCEYQPDAGLGAADRQEASHYIPQYRFDAEKRRIDFAKDSCIVLPPKTVHFKKHTENSRFLSLGFLITDPAIVPQKTHYTTISSKVKTLFNAILEEYQQKNAGYGKMIECLIAEICIELTRDQFVDTGIDDFVKQTMYYIDDHYEIDLVPYCRSNGYSVDYFRHKFKQITGMSPHAYVLQKRMQYACTLLSTTRLSIAYISEICKFTDYAQFSAGFTKRQGMSPSEYRKRHTVLSD